MVEKHNSSCETCFVPTLALLITGFVTFLVIGPLANHVGVEIANVYTWLYNLSPVISGAIFSWCWTILRYFGIHWGIIPCDKLMFKYWV